MGLVATLGLLFFATETTGVIEKEEFNMTDDKIVNKLDDLYHGFLKGERDVIKELISELKDIDDIDNLDYDDVLGIEQKIRKACEGFTQCKKLWIVIGEIKFDFSTKKMIERAKNGRLI